MVHLYFIGAMTINFFVFSLFAAKYKQIEFDKRFKPHKIARPFFFMKTTPSSLRKGDQTKAAILLEALAIANRDGLQGLTIAAIAERCAMSKSGVFSHFGSREELQIGVVEEYHRRFQAAVFTPAMRADKGLPRLTALFDYWVTEVSHEADAGSIYISGAVEFDERQGPVRDALVHSIGTWLSALERATRAAVAANHLKADVDTAQLVFEMHALILALHHDARFLRRPMSQTRAHQGFLRLIQTYSSPRTRLPPPTSPVI